MRVEVAAFFALALTVSGLLSGQRARPAETPSKNKPTLPAPTNRSETPDTQPARAPVQFANDVMPLLTKLGCNQTKCHGSATGKAGFKLSMFGAEPESDYAALTKSAGGRRINKVEPLESLFLLKATESIPHKGGQRFAVGSPEYNLLACWVAQGAPWAQGTPPKLLSVQVSPAERTFQKGQSQQLAAVAVFSDGTEKDVTGYASYQSSEERVATVSTNGRVQAKDYGMATVLVSYLRQSATVRVIVPQPLPFPFPKVQANNQIDELVAARLKQLGIPPSELCSDKTFLRRIYLDTIGTLPTADQAREFLSDADPQKRNRLIDQLLASRQFADYWALKWGDLFRIKSEYPSNLWPNAVQAYHRWVRDSIVQNKPYDQYARQLLTASGSNFRVPPANYYRAFLRRDPQSLAEVTALIFMGARIGCARCHAHPQEHWTLDDNLGLAAFFAQLRYKRTQEWKEEIVYINPKQVMRDPRTNQVVRPKLPDGELIELGPEQDARVRFAQWLTAPDNPWFARNIVNRIWYWLLGRGIVHEPDDMRPTNPPENPPLLDYLAKELVSHGYDLKHIYRLILNSRTYQRSSKSNQWNENDVAHFSHYQVKRLGAETLLDAIGQVTERWDRYRSTIPEPFVLMPDRFRATHLADGSIGLPFLELFGRPARNTAFESERDLELSMRQTLHLLNSSDVQNKINASPRLRRLISEKRSDAEIVDELYLTTLSRPAKKEERAKVLEYVARISDAPLRQPQAAKQAAEQALAKVRAELKKAKADSEAAEQAARQAEAAAAKAKADLSKAAAAQAAAAKAAALKRQQANGAKKKLDELLQKQQQSAEPEAADLKGQVEAATKAYEAAEQAAKDAEMAAAKAKAEADRRRAAQMATQKAAGEKRKLANAARARRDKLARDEKTANNRLAQANRSVNAARGAHNRLRQQALQDLLWALLNTKEFLFNH